MRSDLENSFGSWLALHDGRILIDLRTRTVPRLGYNASALFGVAHLQANWRPATHGVDVGESRSDSDPEFARLLSANRRIQDLLPSSAALHPADLHRSYIESSVIAQYPDQVDRVRAGLASLSEIMSHLKGVATRPAGWLGLEIEVDDASQRDRLAASMRQHGLLLDSRSGGFLARLHLGFSDEDLEVLASTTRRWLTEAVAESPGVPERASVARAKVASSYRFHRRLLDARARRHESTGDANVPDARFGAAAVDYLTDELSQPGIESLEVRQVTVANYRNYRDQIQILQKQIYEPARQTPVADFDALFESERLKISTPAGDITRRSLGLLVLGGGEIIAMALAGPLDLLPHTRGFESDPFRGRPDTWYMVDVTVVPEYRGRLGRLVKNALVLMGYDTMASAIHGRNRDRIARGMWAINLSYGSYELQLLENDYQDDQDFCDCIYYRTPLCWGGTDDASGSIKPDSITAARLPELVNGTQHPSD